MPKNLKLLALWNIVYLCELINKAFFTDGELLHFLELHVIEFLSVQCRNVSITATDWSALSSHIGITILVLSAYLKIILISFKWIFKSFNKTLNKYMHGPLTDPWVMPLLTFLQSPTTSKYTTLCCLPIRKHTCIYQFRMYGLRLIILSFSARSACFTESNALLKSILNNLTALHEGSSMILLRILGWMLSKALVRLPPSLYANWDTVRLLVIGFLAWTV